MLSLNNNTGEITGNHKRQFYRHRKIISCISDGISMYTDNFIKYTSFTILPVVFVSVLLALLLAFAAPCIDITAGGFILKKNSFYAYMAAAAVALLLAVLFISLFHAASYTFIECRYLKNNKLDFKSFFSRSLKKVPPVLLMILVASLAITVTCVGTHCIMCLDFGDKIAGEILKAVCLVVFLSLSIIFFTPLKLVMPSLIYGKGSICKRFKDGYMLGVATWQKTFTQMILTFMIKSVIGVVLLMPLMACVAICKSYVETIAGGDSAHLPNVFIVIITVTGVLTTIVLTYFMSTLNLPYLYLYSSAMADRAEREKNEIGII